MNIEITIFRRNFSNVTDTLFTTLIPLEEYKLDKKKFKEVVLSNDEPFGGWGLGMSNILYINQVFLFVVVHSVAFSLIYISASVHGRREPFTVKTFACAEQLFVFRVALPCTHVVRVVTDDRIAFVFVTVY